MSEQNVFSEFADNSQDQVDSGGMTHRGTETNNDRPNARNGILKNKLRNNPNLAQLNEENGRSHCNVNVDECKLLTKEDTKGINSKVSFVLPPLPVPRDYPIMSWFVDSGASEHMVNSEEYFDDSRELEKPTRVIVAKSGVELKATRVGTIRGHSIVNGQRVEYTFRDVLFVPDLQANLFSVTKVVDLKLKVIFENSICKIVKRDKEVAIAIRDNKLYELKILLHSMYCTPSVMLLRPKKLTHYDKVRTGKHTLAADTSTIKSTASIVKSNIRNIEVRPKQKVHAQEL